MAAVRVARELLVAGDSLAVFPRRRRIVHETELIAEAYVSGAADRAVTEAEKQRQLAREADAGNPGDAERRRLWTLEGLADVDAGRLIDDEAMLAWADSFRPFSKRPLTCSSYGHPKNCGTTGP